MAADAVADLRSCQGKSVLYLLDLCSMTKESIHGVIGMRIYCPNKFVCSTCASEDTHHCARLFIPAGHELIDPDATMAKRLWIKPLGTHLPFYLCQPKFHEEVRGFSCILLAAIGVDEHET